MDFPKLSTLLYKHPDQETGHDQCPKSPSIHLKLDL